MGSKADQYRREAEEAEQAAETTTDISARATYKGVAEHYRYLAEQYEKLDGGTTPKEGH
jgi:hypothetical protein